MWRWHNTETCVLSEKLFFLTNVKRFIQNGKNRTLNDNRLQSSETACSCDCLDDDAKEKSKRMWQPLYWLIESQSMSNEILYLTWAQQAYLTSIKRVNFIHSLVCEPSPGNLLFANTIKCLFFWCGKMLAEKVLNFS